MRTDYGRFTVRPYTPHLGADVDAVHLGDFDDELIKLLHDAWMDWKVLFFHDQDITADDHRAFALQFGEIDKHPYLDAEGDMAVIDNAESPRSRSPWHTDATFRSEPPYASFLIARILPPVGGDTCFGNMERAYECLTDEVKSQIDGRTATHSVAINFARHLSGRDLEVELEKFPPQQHPIVRTHPVTGRKSLYVSRSFTLAIDDMDPVEGERLLDHLICETHRVEHQMRFRWQVNSMAMWDNRCTQHAPVYDYGPHRRRVERFTLAGDRPA
ncbi:MAG: TauD/TfdA dioxygenase family protein [Acidimicrobiales bacterium]